MALLRRPVTMQQRAHVTTSRGKWPTTVPGSFSTAIQHTFREFSQSSAARADLVASLGIIIYGAPWVLFFMGFIFRGFYFLWVSSPYEN